MLVIIWGCGRHLENCLDNMPDMGEVIFMDQAVNLQRNGWKGNRVLAPQLLNFFYYDKVVIGSEIYKEEIHKILTEKFHVDNSKISYIDDIIETKRTIDVESISEFVSHTGIVLLSDRWRTIYDIEYLFPDIDFKKRIVFDNANSLLEFLKSNASDEHYVISNLLINDILETQLDESGIAHYNSWITDMDLICLLEVDNPALISDLYKKIKMTSSKHAPVCQKPFNCIEIHGLGDVRVCCPAYMNPVGNLRKNRFSEIWKGGVLKLVRLSVANRSYALCSQERCPFMIQNVNDSDILPVVNKKMYEIKSADKPYRLNLATDYTCNLSCPSCREKVRIAGKDYLNDISEINREIISEILPYLKEVQIAGDGEVFFSKIYRDIIYSGNHLDIRLELLSNGTLFTDENFGPLIDKWKGIDLILSMDGIKQETLEKLRRGLKYDIFMKNVEYISKMHREGKIGRWCLDFVLQKDNVEELDLYIETMKQYGVDEIRILALLPGAFDDFKEKRICDSSGNIFNEYIRFFSNKILNDPIINWWSVKKPETSIC